MFPLFLREALRRLELRLLPLLSPLTASQLILTCRDIAAVATQESSIGQKRRTSSKGHKRDSERKGKENEKSIVQDLISSVKGTNKNNQTLDPEKKEKESRTRRAEELLLLKLSIVAVMLLIKTISDYSARLALPADDSHKGRDGSDKGRDGSEGTEGPRDQNFSSLLLKLKLQLLVLPLFEGRTDEVNADMVGKNGIDVGEETIEADGRENGKIEKNENCLESSYYCSMAVSLSSLCSITVEDRSDELEGLRSRLRALSAAQHALAHLLRVLTTRQPHPSRLSRLSHLSHLSKGEKVIEEEEDEEERKEERERECVWLDVMSLCGGLMSSATTSAFLFYSLPLLPLLPAPACSSSSRASGPTSSFIDRYLSLHSPSYVSLMVSIAIQRRMVRKRERVSHLGGDSTDRETDELWEIVLHILSDPRPSVAASTTDPTGDRSMDYAAYLLSLVLVAWQEGGDIRELERRTLDLILDDSRTMDLIPDDSKTSNSRLSSGSSIGRGERLRALLRLCLLTWRRDGGVFTGCTCGASGGSNGNIKGSIKASSCSRTRTATTEGPPCPYCLSQSPHTLSPDPLFSPDRLRAVQVSPSFLLKLTDRTHRDHNRP